MMFLCNFKCNVWEFGIYLVNMSVSGFNMDDEQKDIKKRIKFGIEIVMFGINLKIMEKPCLRPYYQYDLLVKICDNIVVMTCWPSYDEDLKRFHISLTFKIGLMSPQL